MTDDGRYFRCQVCPDAVVRVMPGAEWPQPCQVCRQASWAEIPRPANVRVCPYCDNAYPATFGTCWKCEDR